MMMPWWGWVVAGIVLLLAELLTPGGFFMIFFGLAALLVGLMAALGIAGPQWAQLGLFSVLSVLFLVVFRKRLVEKFKPKEGLDRQLADVVGGVAVAQVELAPNALGKAEFRGTSWNARNVGAAPVPKGGRCRVEGVDGLMLKVVAE